MPHGSVCRVIRSSRRLVTMLEATRLLCRSPRLVRGPFWLRSRHTSAGRRVPYPSLGGGGGSRALEREPWSGPRAREAPAPSLRSRSRSPHRAARWRRVRGRLVSSPTEAHDGYGARPPCGRLGCLPFRDVQVSRRSRPPLRCDNAVSSRVRDGSATRACRGCAKAAGESKDGDPATCEGRQWPTAISSRSAGSCGARVGCSSDRSSLSAGAFSRRERARNGIASAEIPAPNR